MIRPQDREDGSARLREGSWLSVGRLRETLIRPSDIFSHRMSEKKPQGRGPELREQLQASRGLRQVCFSRGGKVNSSVKGPFFFSKSARRSQTDTGLALIMGIGSILTSGLPRRVTTTATPLAATRSQISENFVFASNSPMTSMSQTYQSTR